MRVLENLNINLCVAIQLNVYQAKTRKLGISVLLLQCTADTKNSLTGEERYTIAADIV